MPVSLPPKPTATAMGTASAPGMAGFDKSTATTTTREPAQKSLWQLLNISIGFLGIQFAWAIQMGQMSPLLERLGSAEWLTPLLWCAGPVTGILVQPIVGSLSDKTWTRLGRRRPFLLVGAILTALSLILMPNSVNLLMAALLLWVLDASINISQGPYRALVPDVVAKNQQAFTYSLMSFTIGLGSVAAFTIGSMIPSMHNLFYLGAFAMLVAMTWTILTTPETQRVQPAEQTPGFGAFIRQTLQSIGQMPREAKKLCLMHSFTWFGLQFLFIYFSLFMAHNLFGATDSTSAAYTAGVQKASLCYAALNAVCFLVAPFIGKLCERFSKKAVHTLGLACMAGGLLSMPFLTQPDQAMIAMGFIGIGWATTLSVPFALLAAHVPAGKEGVLMGTFNIFIAAPQFVASMFISALKFLAAQQFVAATAIGFLAMQIHNDAMALAIGGVAILTSAFILQFIKE